jgi:hypothetical protein
MHANSALAAQERSTRLEESSKILIGSGENLVTSADSASRYDQQAGTTPWEIIRCVACGSCQ